VLDGEPSDQIKIVLQDEEGTQSFGEATVPFPAYSADVEAELSLSGGGSLRLALSSEEEVETLAEDGLQNEANPLFKPTDANKDSFVCVKPWLGSIFPPEGYHVPPDAEDPPAVSLQLDWAFGYRGHDARQNLYYTPKGHVVYHTAAIGVVLNPDEQSQRFFVGHPVRTAHRPKELEGVGGDLTIVGGHSDDIVSLAYHKPTGLVATGQMGKNPKICVWNSETLELVAELQGFLERAVTALDFSPVCCTFTWHVLLLCIWQVFMTHCCPSQCRSCVQDGTKVIAVGEDDNHTLAMYDIATKAKIANCPGDKGKVLCVRFRPDGREICVCGIKHIKFVAWDGAVLKPKRGIFGGEVQSVLSAHYVGEKCYAGLADGRLAVWVGGAIVQAKEAHKGPVISVRCTEKGVIATGGRDGKVRVWSPDLKITNEITLNAEVRSLCFSDDEQRMLVGTVNNCIFEVDIAAGSGATEPIMSGPAGELWGLCMHTQLPNVFVTACADGKVRLYDADNHRMVDSCQVAKDGKADDLRCCDVSPKGKFVAVGTEDGSVVVLDAEHWTEKARFKDATTEISFARFSPDGLRLVAGSHDRKFTAYNIGARITKAGALQGHTGAILHCDFSEDSAYVQSTSASYEILYHNLKTGQLVRAGAMKDTAWKSWTCTLGWPVQGIWRLCADGTDVNALARSHDGRVLATVEDTGFVKLFRYPCIGSGFVNQKLERRPQNSPFAGHSSHVTNVVWTPDDRKLITTGGADRSVLVWRVVATPIPETA
jgi:microtubule-associated protein-like 6